MEYAYNNSVHSSSGYTPFYLCYGRHPLSPVQLLSQVELKNAAANAFLQQLEEDVTHAMENLRSAQEKQKQYADKWRRDVEFQVGDEVLLATKTFPAVVVAGGSSKLTGLASDGDWAPNDQMWETRWELG